MKRARVNSKWDQGECEGGFGAGGIHGCQMGWAEACVFKSP